MILLLHTHKVVNLSTLTEKLLFVWTRNYVDHIKKYGSIVTCSTDFIEINIYEDLSKLYCIL